MHSVAIAEGKPGLSGCLESGGVSLLKEQVVADCGLLPAESYGR